MHAKPHATSPRRLATLLLRRGAARCATRFKFSATAHLASSPAPSSESPSGPSAARVAGRRHGGTPRHPRGEAPHCSNCICRHVCVVHPLSNRESVVNYFLQSLVSVRRQNGSKRQTEMIEHKPQGTLALARCCCCCLTRRCDGGEAGGIAGKGRYFLFSSFCPCVLIFLLEVRSGGPVPSLDCRHRGCDRDQP